ncbi:DNA polymerase/3'-5' exonuclease PolX [Paenisporosarcina sp. TG20]|uniref:DNA polymerase/3'-5' exonuclease PolX n=1 Tax=Paenisporosarcina sp. TG20 TaxID=1211706 RepID=UPI00031BC7F6|nr:DNA polymerase/3'-5' exonuclease PolX [Paenisporosarcina sp. TG20]
MNKKIIIKTLERIALYMELKGENSFKVSAFRRAAQALELDARSLAEIEDVTKLKGIGKGTASVIEDLITTGESSVLKELEASVPSGLFPLLQVAGLGGKKIAKLYQELGVDSVETLKQACIDKKVQVLAGFGVKTEEKILKELDHFETRPDRLPIWRLETAVLMIEKVLSEIPQIDKFSVAGSFRRVKETSKDLDFIIASTEIVAVREALIKELPVTEIIAAGDTKVSFTIDYEVLIDVDFRIVEPAAYITALHHFTGSKNHNVKLRQIAKSQGKKISEYGVEQEDGSNQTFDSEVDFFAHFGLPYFPPTVREDSSEFERQDELETLIQVESIQSDLHMHTTWSDGAHSLGEMIEACIEKGYTHMVITDHSHYLRIANGLSAERLREQIAEIRKIQQSYPTIKIMTGTEMDILPDGSLDFDDDLLEELDFVIASIHSSFSQPQEKIMERLFSAIKNKHVDMIAHPTGRIIGKRTGYNPDVSQLIKWAAEYGKILELNANPYRLDIATEYLIEAQKLHVPIAINTDAHAIDQLRFMDIGVKYAQKAWLKQDLIVNTWSYEKLENYLKK